ncbi:hypothetical protein [Pseudoalteromonas sp. MMG012]|uniref:hypothetical protein n=1 Tax=Pseudoalteromonas sp. MMG012 TaxID=2822686 RepID=UPI001B3A1ED1|nr:hypothetical protein [Pseudoalteromonas sp. MMG012]MBQ4852147.1 hypothetical protein [Pseudoalteromonas sp. MMG012]
MSQWLLARLQEQSKEILQPQFAFQGAMNWLRSLSLIIESTATIQDEANDLYADIPLRKHNRTLDTKVFDNIHFAFQNIASLNALNTDVEFKSDICNSAIVCWHDAIVFSAKAMVCAYYDHEHNMDELNMVNKLWQESIVTNELIPSPFNLSIPTLVKKESEAIIKRYRGTNTYTLDYSIRDKTMAYGGLCSNLKGTHGYELWKAEIQIKETEHFKSLGVDSFRTKIAREYRDQILSEGSVNFLVQANRFRGKSNYRDSIYLTYGENNSESLKIFINDLLEVSTAFLKCASIYCSKRVEPDTWNSFVDDIEENTCLTIEVDIIKPN